MIAVSHPTRVAAAALGFLVTACADRPTAPLNPADATTMAATGRAAPMEDVAALEIGYMKFTIDHHTGGTVMAGLCIERAVNHELRALCQESLADQTREKQKLQRWLHQWYAMEYQGMIEPEAAVDIRRLSGLQGADFEKDFLDTFSKHHVMIVKRSKEVLNHLYHDELESEIARPIIVKQSDGVRKMQSWDCHWYDDCDNEWVRQL